MDKGIPMVALDTVGLPGSKVRRTSATTTTSSAPPSPKEALKRLPPNPSGLVVLGNPNPGVPVLDSRVKGIVDTFAAEAPGIRTKGPFETFSDPGKSYNAWSSLVRANARRGRVPRRRRRRQLLAGPGEEADRREVPDGGLRPRRPDAAGGQGRHELRDDLAGALPQGLRRDARCSPTRSRTARRCRRAGSACPASSSTPRTSTRSSSGRRRRSPPQGADRARGEEDRRGHRRTARPYGDAR